jgi:hypothetical protein
MELRLKRLYARNDITSRELRGFYMKVFQDMGNFHANEEVFVGLTLINVVRGTKGKGPNKPVTRDEDLVAWSGVQLGVYFEEPPAEQHPKKLYAKRLLKTGMVFPQATAAHNALKERVDGISIAVDVPSEVPAVVIEVVKVEKSANPELNAKLLCKMPKGFIEVCHYVSLVQYVMVYFGVNSNS